MNQYIERVVDLVDPASQQLHGLSLDAARDLLRHGPATAIRNLAGSFALTASQGKLVRMARSLDRPMRYFLAKRAEGPALVVAERIDTLRQWLAGEGLADQFHPSYTRMVPAHHVVELELIGCPDPSPTYTRFFTPSREVLPPDPEVIGQRYVAAVADEVARWLGTVPATEPIGVCFSGGIDSGAVFLVTYHVMRKLGLNLGRLKAFTLSIQGGPDLEQARAFLDRLGLGLFLEPIEADLGGLDLTETIRIVEDYKPLDLEAAAMVLALSRGIRQRYPDWRYLLHGDGGDENLKDYPIEDNPELTIRSVLHNLMLYHEGWGVGKLKHSLTYSGGLSRGCARTYAPLRHCGFLGFGPFTCPSVVEVAEGIPFTVLTGQDVQRLYALKGEIVAHGVRAVTGLELPVFPKRRFQHGAVREELLRQRLPTQEAACRRQFLALYE